MNGVIFHFLLADISRDVVGLICDGSESKEQLLSSFVPPAVGVNSRSDRPSAESAATPFGGKMNLLGLLVSNEQKWPISFWKQTMLLTRRSFFENRGNMFTLYTLLESVLLAAVGCFVFFQLPDTAAAIPDRWNYVCCFSFSFRQSADRRSLAFLLHIRLASIFPADINCCVYEPDSSF